MAGKSSKNVLEEKLDATGVALLENAYGGILNPTEGAEKIVDIDPRVFRAVVDWIRVKNKLDPDDTQESGLDKLTSRLGR
jgi:hypothetical protein